MLFVADDGRRARLTRWLYGHISDLAVRWGRRRGRSLLALIERVPGRRARTSSIERLPHIVSPTPENAFRRVIEFWPPDVVVGNSLVRLTWRRVRDTCASRGIPTILYVREVSTCGHVAAMPDPADAIVANATSLADAVRALGHTCALIPSVVDTSVTSVESTRSVALLVNPIESHGIGLLWKLADRMPEVSFEVRESWPLSDEAVLDIERHARKRANVDFRRRSAPGPEVYGRARLLLVPHLIDNRPRVVIEAQSNAIPVLASDQPGLAEAVGDGGLILPPDDADSWAKAIRSLWPGGAEYDELSRAAQQHSRREDLQPSTAVAAFEAVLRRVASDEF